MSSISPPSRDDQPHAIVSRILSRRAGATSPFSPSTRGKRLSEHSAPFDVLVQILDGKMEVRSEGRRPRPHGGRRPSSCPPPSPRPEGAEATKMILTMIRS